MLMVTLDANSLRSFLPKWPVKNVHSRTYSGELIAAIKAPGYTDGSSLSWTIAGFTASRTVIIIPRNGLSLAYRSIKNEAFYQPVFPLQLPDRPVYGGGLEGGGVLDRFGSVYI